MKKVLSVFLALLFVFLTGCSCSHEWVEATCTTPKTCSLCGEVEDETTAPHTWAEATCTEAKTCSACGATEGSANGHSWAEATCDSSKTCLSCGLKEGSPLEHEWKEATCTEPKTCTLCGKEWGSALGHDYQGGSCTEDSTCSRCGDVSKAPGHSWNPATCTTAKTCKSCGLQEGEALGHTTASGVCSRCGEDLFVPITNSGKGDTAISGIEVNNDYFHVLKFKHSGKRNIIVHCYDCDGDRELLINEIGKYDGVVLLPGNGPYILNIQADGSWEYTIDRVGSTTDKSFSGKGDYVTPIFSASTGIWKFTHDGDSNFAVWAYTTDGRDLVINEIGGYSGTQIVEIPSGSRVMFEITADGNWSITPQ